MRNALLAGLVLWCPYATAQDVEQMVTDRPSFRNSARLVAPTVAQFEIGWRLQDERLPGQSNVFAVEPLLRFGATRWLELRLQTERCVLQSPRVSDNEDPPTGCRDLEPGVKVRLLQTAAGTSMAAIVKVGTPTGHRSQTSAGYDPSIELIWEQQVPLGFTGAAMVRATRTRDENGALWTTAGSLALHHEIGRKFESFGEVYVISPKEHASGNQWMFDTGVARTLGRFIRVDASAGHSVRHNPGEWFLMLGLSVRSLSFR